MAGLVALDDITGMYEEVKEASLVGGCSVLILVAADCDAVCAARILTSLLRADGITFLLRPVRSLSQMQGACRELCGDGAIQSVVFLNCGAVDSLSSDIAAWHPSVRGYVIDSHRPVYHSNIRALPLRVLDSAVPLAMADVPSDGDSDADLEAVPTDDPEGPAGWSSDDSDGDSSSTDEDSGDEDGDGEGRKRGRAGDGSRRWQKRGRTASAGDAGLVRGGRHGRRVEADRRERRRALVRRAARWQSYYGEHYHAAPSAFCLYQLAAALGRGQNDLLWLALVAVTAAYFEGAFGDEDYEKLVSGLQDEVSRFNADTAAIGDGTAEGAEARDLGDAPSEVTPAGRTGHVASSMELRLPLLRHWTLLDALYCSEDVAAALGTWDMDVGRDAILNLVAHVGIPLAECRQPWAHMSRSARIAVRTRLAPKAAEAGVLRSEYPSFTRQLGFEAPLAAHDVALAVSALLESGGDAGALAATTLVETAEGMAREFGLSGAAARALAPQAAVAAASRGSGSSAQLDAWSSGFARAFAALSTGTAGRDALRAGVSLAQRHLRGIARLCPRLIRNDGKHCVAQDTFNVRRIDDLSDADAKVFTQPGALAQLGRAVVANLRASTVIIRRQAEAAAALRGRPVRLRLPTGHGRPFLFCARDASSGLYTVVGLPFAEDTRATTTRTFQRDIAAAAVDSGAQHVCEGFDGVSIWVDAARVDVFLARLHMAKLAEGGGGGAAEAGAEHGGGGGGGFGFGDDDDDDDDDDDAGDPREDVDDGFADEDPGSAGPGGSSSAGEDDDDDEGRSFGGAPSPSLGRGTPLARMPMVASPPRPSPGPRLSLPRSPARAADTDPKAPRSASSLPAPAASASASSRASAAAADPAAFAELLDRAADDVPDSATPPGAGRVGTAFEEEEESPAGYDAAAGLALLERIEGEAGPSQASSAGPKAASAPAVPPAEEEDDDDDDPLGLADISML